MTYEVQGCGTVETGPRYKIVNEWGESAGFITDSFDSATEAALALNREYEVWEYVREEFEEIIIQGAYKFMDYSQDDIRVIIRQVADEGGY